MSTFFLHPTRSGASIVLFFCTTLSVQFQKIGKMLWTVPCCFLFGFQFIDCVSAGNQCREEVSVSGMALKGFVFKKFSVTALHECDISCEREITCQSYNYAAGEKSCELNNRTNEARSENFHSDPAWFYKRRLRDRGMYNVDNSRRFLSSNLLSSAIDRKRYHIQGRYQIQVNRDTCHGQNLEIIIFFMFLQEVNTKEVFLFLISPRNCISGLLDVEI